MTFSRLLDQCPGQFQIETYFWSQYACFYFPARRIKRSHVKLHFMEESLCFIYRQMNTSGAYINKRIVTKCTRYTRPTYRQQQKLMQTLNVFTKEIRKHAIKPRAILSRFFFLLSRLIKCSNNLSDNMENLRH